MNNYPKRLVIFLGLSFLGITNIAVAHKWDINDTATYHLVNYSNYPIQYGIGTVYNNTNDAETSDDTQDYDDWVSNITVTPDPGSPNPSTKNGITGEISPADNTGPNGVSIAVTGNYHHYNFQDNNDHHAPKYQLNFTWPGGGDALFYNGQVSHHGDASLSVIVTPVSLPYDNSSAGNLVTACISNLPKLERATGPNNQSETVNVSFYNASLNQPCS